jgi:hypothetical protein
MASSTASASEDKSAIVHPQLGGDGEEVVSRALALAEALHLMWRYLLVWHLLMWHHLIRCSAKGFGNKAYLGALGAFMIGPHVISI